MKEILSKIDDIVERYESGAWVSAEELRLLNRELNTSLYRLSKFNIEFHQKHNAVQYKHKGSVASGKLLAEEQWPEVRMIRKITEAAENVSRSMTMELSIIKKEK